ncbi:MAG: extracellular solute-binding protein [Bacteroidota bacterium]
MNLNYFFRLVTFFVITTILVYSCAIKDAEEQKRNYLTIYTDINYNQDTLLFNKFEKEEKIKVYVKYLPKDSIIKTLKREHFNSNADLLLLSNYDLLKKANRKNLLLPIKSDILDENVDPSYRSRKKTWYGLSKTPLVIIYNEKALKRDTLKSYHELLKPKWAGKISLQEKNNSTYRTFRNNLHFLLKNEADSFLLKLNKQVLLAKQGDDFTQINRINRRESLLSIVKLSSLAELQTKYDYKSPKNVRDVEVIFPNQRKRGCYLSITGAGVYRYAKNSANAIKMLEFLSSKRAQYKYAETRFDYPLLRNTEICYALSKFRKFRARFYKY